MATSSSSNLRVEYALEPLSPGRSRSRNGRQYFGEAAVDIIAVQGLGSTYDWTWSAEVPGLRERYYWLRSSICREMPHARVLAFEYDTRWLGDTDNVSLSECGSRLLRAILQDQAHTGDSRMCPTRSRRPIMFIGHSFGGLVIKQRDRYEPDYNDHQAFLMAVTSVFFLGTPHTGSSFPRLAKIKILVSRPFGVDSEERLLSLLHTGSEELEELQKKFNKVKYLDRAKTFQENKPATELYCYYEQKKMRLGPFPTGHVVTEGSACLEGATNRGMEADHMGLNKFKSDDKNYNVTLKPDLLKEYARCADTSEDRFAERQYGSERANSELHGLNQKLLPTVLIHRTRRDFMYQEQQRIYPPTCSWIAGIEAFRRWRSSCDFSCLWIHGKAGSGKSVLASYITKLLQPNEHDQSHDSQRCENLLSSNFCRARNATGPAMVYFLCGVDPALESPASMLGALIHQLLFRFDEDRNLQSIALSTLRKVKAQVTPQELALLFMEVASIAGRVYVVIDGLDENKDYVRVLEEFICFAGNACISLLFLSRNVYNVEQHLKRSFRTVQDFDIIQYSGPDINTVAEFRTEELVVLKPELAFQRQMIEDYLKKKAEGVFLWLGAARDQLDRSCMSPDDVQKTLNGLYPEMNHMYQILHQQNVS
ncbi:hypothetical protein C8F04DRAFT_1271190 [Mycena alexandri]|uniref:Nephrocystin 3-like N-terminal domain-containing protein n=1 Tax=Mycena alexandri TaxID=1745969 RepID=A0AAD6SC89_9AGAR|nr:hypothetical protein C8F04DRAFT_1271190 [Mycena alexandri]